MSIPLFLLSALISVYPQLALTERTDLSRLDLRYFSSSKNDSQADRLVGAIQSHYARISGLAADFEQIYEAPGQQARSETGRLFLAKPRRMRWEYDSDKLFVVNDRDVWWYVPADREATHSDARSLNDARLPFLFLLDNPNLKANFTGIEIAGGNHEDRNQRLLRLNPKRRDTGVREIIVTSDANGAISKVKLTEDGGATSQILLKKVRENFHIQATAFAFIPPPGVTVRRQK